MEMQSLIDGAVLALREMPAGFGMQVAECLILAAYAATSVAVAVVDARTRRIPNGMCMALAMLGIAHCALCALCDGLLGATALDRGTARLLAGVLAAALLGGFEELWRKTHGSRHGMGFGDVKLIAAQALFLGRSVVPALACACLAGGVLSLLGGRKDFAFGPYISLACVLFLMLRYAAVLQ